MDQSVGEQVSMCDQVGVWGEAGLGLARGSARAVRVRREVGDHGRAGGKDGTGAGAGT